MDIRGRGVLVTGASRGLGAALSREFARAGAKVVLVARSEAALGDVVESIRAAGGEAHAIAADLGDKRAIHRVAGAAAALVGEIEVVVHNASTLGVVPLRALVDTDCESLEEALNLNVVAPFRLTKALLPAMLLKKRGLVVQITSDAGTNAYPTWGAYGVSKAALDQLGRVFGAELEASGVRVLSIDPGEMDTKMHADAVPDADRATLLQPEVVAARIVRIVRDAESLPNGARVEARS